MAIDITGSRERLSNFLNKNQVGVLATSDTTGKPHAATVYFTFNKQFDVYFITKRETQKRRNLQTNNLAAIAIYDANQQATVQAEGTVIEVTDAKQMEWIYNDIWHIASKTNPNSAPPPSQLTAGGYIVYKMAAPSLRMATFVHQDPADSDKIFEIVSTQPSLDF